MFEKIRKIICEQLEIEEERVGLETSFEELDVDSLDLFQVIVDIEDQFGVQIEDAENLKTIKDIIDYIEAKKAE